MTFLHNPLRLSSKNLVFVGLQVPKRTDLVRQIRDPKIFGSLQVAVVCLLAFKTHPLVSLRHFGSTSRHLRYKA